MCYTIVATAVYVLAIAVLFAPKCPKAAPAVDPTAPIDYFPEVEEETETEPEAIAVLVNLAVQALAQLNPTPAPEVAEPADLASLGIRALKKMASAAKIPHYSKMTKQQLIGALA
jgi:hypothetical protein